MGPHATCIRPCALHARSAAFVRLARVAQIQIHLCGQPLVARAVGKCWKLARFRLLRGAWAVSPSIHFAISQGGIPIEDSEEPGFRTGIRQSPGETRNLFGFRHQCIIYAPKRVSGIPPCEHCLKRRDADFPGILSGMRKNSSDFCGTAPFEKAD